MWTAAGADRAVSCWKKVDIQPFQRMQHRKGAQYRDRSAHLAFCPMGEKAGQERVSAQAGAASTREGS